MRELHGWHEANRDPRRHAHDALADAPGKHAHDAPKHAAHDSPKFKVLLDPAVRVAESLRSQKAVQEYEAKHAAGQPRPQESKPEHAPPETRDKLTGKLAEKWDSPESQREERRRPERSWLPRADAVKAISDVAVLATTIAVALGDAAARWDAVAAGAATTVVSNVAWANRRWKEKHGDRPED
jgi:hypothetical protein